jgi:MFS family permease
VRGGEVILRRQPEYAKLWSGQAISAVGSRITTVAMPLTAVVVLHASAAQMGVLAALTMLPHLLFGLPAGVWVDRISRRAILVVADVGRAVALGVVPLLAVLGLLRIEHLYVVAVLTGTMTLFFDTAATTLVPALVGRENLVRANSAWVLSNTVANTVGPSLGGLLVQVLTAPVAIAFDAVSFLLSTGCSLLVRVAEAPRRRGRVRLWPDTFEGLRSLFAGPILRPVAVSATAGAFAGAMQGALLVLYLVRDLALTPAQVGLAFAVAGGASVGGALLARAWSERLGPGPSYIAGQFLFGTGVLVMAAATGPTAAVLAMLLVALVLTGGGPPLFQVPQVTLRQSLTPEHVLGRVNAAWRFLVFGVQPLGALLGGALGAAIGPRAALVVSGLGVLAASLRVFRSPVRSLRQIPGSDQANVV